MQLTLAKRRRHTRTKNSKRRRTEIKRGTSEAYENEENPRGMVEKQTDLDLEKDIGRPVAGVLL